MVDSRLVSYIQQQLKNGYDIAIIRNSLLQNNYPPEEIDAAFQSLGGISKQQIQQLTEYIKQNITKGYSGQQIQQFLLQQGYPSTAINNAYQQAMKKSFGLSVKTLLIAFLIILVIAALGATAWFFMNMEPTVKQEPSFSISLDIDTVAPGDTLYVNNDFTYFPSIREYPITVYYTLNDNTQTRIDSWQISMGTSDALLKNTKYIIPRTTISGTYTLDATMNYGTLSRQASALFTVSIDQEEIAAAEVRSETTQEETSEPATTKTIEVVETATETIIPGQDDYKNLAFAKESAPTDPATALQYCALISTQTKIDECYWNVAKLSTDKSYCEIIVADHTRDSCWIGFAFEQNDYSVCEEISNPFLKQSCDQLKKVAELKAMQEQTY
ncbi:MAG: hypothetical protein WC254_00130 [Candidatus Woesearchaeota archaeon]|jgi:hypothetical protein